MNLKCRVYLKVTAQIYSFLALRIQIPSYILTVITCEGNIGMFGICQS